MSAKLRLFLRLLTLDNNEMKNSYIQFQKESERTLVSFFNLMVLPVSLTILVFGFINHVSYYKVIVRGLAVLFSAIAFLLRKKYPTIQKVILTLIVGAALTIYILDTDLIPDHEHDFFDSFMLGNGFGVVEMILIISFKCMIMRSAVFGTFIIIKLVVMLQQMAWTQYRNALVLFAILFTLIFLLLDHMLDKRIFKMVYESKDKLKKFQTLLSNDLPSSVVIINSSLNSILYSNDFFRKRFLGEDDFITDQELDVQVFSKFMVHRVIDKRSQDHEEIPLISFLQNVDKTLSFPMQEAVMTLFATFRNEEESEFHYEIKLRKIVWEGNASYAIVLHDVSDKERVVALKLADEQKDKVIATVSHELRTPINGILGLLEMIITRTMDAVALDYLDYAKSCSKLLLYLVNSILDLSQIRHNCLKITKISFNRDRFLEELRSLYIFHSQQKGIDFRIVTEPSVPKDIYTDKYRLVQILINLLGNAMKFTFQGSITLTISTDKDDPYKLMFFIEDTGIGIKEEDKPKLFKMFGKINQSDKSINSQGVGLGLTIANELVKMLNDDKEEKIQFESEYGKGTKFWFRIEAFVRSPSDSFCSILSQQELDPSDLREHSIESSNRFTKKLVQYSGPTYLNSKLELMKFSFSGRFDESNHKKGLRLTKSTSARHILLVDDSPFNLMAAAFIIGQLGFLTQKAFNGQEGINYLKQSQESGKQYSMILTDIQMPILDGLEMSKCISQSIKKGEIYEVPIVAVTAKKLSEKEKTQYAECGISHSMEKPLVIEDMKSVLEKLGLFQQVDNTKATL